VKNEPVINYPLKTTDSKGNVVRYENSIGYKYWKEFDDKNNCIHFRDSEEFEYWQEFNKNNKCIHHKNSDKFEYWQEFDENNKLFYYRDSDGYECWFDSKGNVIPNPNLIKEVTLEEIAEKFKIPVKNLKIKDGLTQTNKEPSQTTTNASHA